MKKLLIILSFIMLAAAYTIRSINNTKPSTSTGQTAKITPHLKAQFFNAINFANEAQIESLLQNHPGLAQIELVGFRTSPISYAIDIMNTKAKNDLAMYNNLEKIIALLIQHGADINHPDINQRTPLDMAFYYQDYDTIKQLLNFGVNLKNFTKDYIFQIIENATQNNDIDLLKALLRYSKKFDKKIDIDFQNKSNKTPLMHAATAGNLDILKLLLENGASINIQDIRGNTPLIYAATADHANIAKLLLENGALTDTQNIRGDTALMIATDAENEDIIKLLLEYGANRTIANNSGQTALGLSTPGSTIEDLLKNYPPLEAAMD